MCPLVNIAAELQPLDAFLWSATADGEPLAAQEVLKEAAVATASAVNVWTLIEEPGATSLDRLAVMPGVADVRWLGDGRAFLTLDHQGPYVFVALPTAHEGVVVLASSVSPTDDRWRRLRRWVTRRVSGLAPVFLNEEEFLAIGDVLSEHGAVEASRLTARDLSDGSSYTRGWPERRRRSRPSHREALAEAEKLVVRTITLHVGDRLLVQLRREAGATFYSGDYALFDATVLSALAQSASRRRSLLTGRERQINEPNPRPLAVRTRGGTFAEPEAIVELLETLERQQSTGVAVFHRNPYLHATVTDYADGSNFDVFVNESDELVVIPGYRATVSSLARLTDSVSERFAAVEVTEVATPTAPRLSDFLGDG